MNVLIKKLFVGLCLTALVFPVYSANDHAHGRMNKNFKKISKLERQVAQIQIQLAALAGGLSSQFTGAYSSVFFENQSFSCGDTADPANPNIFGTQDAVDYFQEQSQSGNSVRSVLTTASADGQTLYFQPHQLLQYEQRLSGLYETDTKSEGNFSVNISPSGALSLDAGPNVSVSGQMSEGGFLMLIQQTAIEGNCTDASMTMVIGVKQPAFLLPD